MSFSIVIDNKQKTIHGLAQPTWLSRGSYRQLISVLQAGQGGAR
jgi:hypothetical protein